MNFVNSVINPVDVLGEKMSKSVIERASDNIRILAASMVEKAKSGHPGGAMGGADFINVLYSEFLRFDPDDMAWSFRDRFFLDPGHMSPMLYAELALIGKFSIEDLKQFRQWGSPTHGHPELNVERGIENTSGPLGMGHAMALGSAIAERYYASRFGEWTAHKTYTFISDGGIQEEISQGVGRLAGHLGLSNYIMFYDSNDIQLSHSTSSVTSEDTTKKYEAWGWRVETIDGHNIEQIRTALKNANAEKEKPTLIIGKTIMGKGALDSQGNNFERQCSTHGQPISKAGASFEKTIINLGGNPENPFGIFDDVSDFYLNVLTQKKVEASKQKKNQANWEKENPVLWKTYKDILQGTLPEIDFSAIKTKPGCATRVASGDTLAIFAEKLDNIIVSSADLSNSDNTGLFLNKTTQMKKGDFSGSFLQAGVAELTMAAIMNGMALHGDIIPVCATFFVFSDYMKPAFRMAALMALPVKYVWTHDSFRVGEDGPTHQPVEQELQVRLLEKMNNLEGKRSMLVLRPADATETVVAWKMALENNTTPTALILTRQNLIDLPTQGETSRYMEALDAQRGAYIIKDVNDGKPDIIFVANGSEVSLLLETAQKLKKEKNINARVVSAISEGLFRDQTIEYQQQIIPEGLPVFGVTAGLPETLQGMVGILGKVMGMQRFGASAPFTILDEKFNYTPERVVEAVLKYVDEYKETIEKIKAL